MPHRPSKAKFKLFKNEKADPNPLKTGKEATPDSAAISQQ